MKALHNLYEALAASSNGAELEAVSARFRRLAQQNKGRLTEFVADLPIDAECALFEIYEALAPAAAGFHEFFSQELQRLLTAAESAPSNRHIYASLEAFGFLHSADDDPLQAALRKILSSHMESSELPVRRFATWLMGDFVKADSQQELDRLFSALDSDPDWRVRYMAYLSLCEGPAADSALALSWLDNLRVSWAGRKAHDYVAV